MAHLIECGFQDTGITTSIEFASALKKDSLLAYASEAWWYHAVASYQDNDSNNRTTQFICNIKAFPAFTLHEPIRPFDILTPLHIIASYRLPLAFVEDIVDGDPNIATGVHKRSPLIVAAQSGHEVLVANLLAQTEVQVNLVDNGGWSALMHAADRGRERCVKLLLAHPEIQVNLVTSTGESVLMWAAYEGREGVMKLLLTHPDIEVNLVDSWGSSALIWATIKGHIGVVKVLLAHAEIQVNAANMYGTSALMRAAFMGHEDVVKLLLSHYEIQGSRATEHSSTALVLAGDTCLSTCACDVNASDKKGGTAIKFAAQGGYTAIVRLLLDVPNIDITIRSTADEHTAMSAAQESGHMDIVELLQDFGRQQASRAHSPNITQLSWSTDEDGSDFDSDSEGAFYDAEEGVSV
jgi:ankyrin repeat protein